MPAKRSYVLDSYALLAYLDDEISASRIEAVLGQVGKAGARIFMSEINLGEVLYITERQKGQSVAQATLSALEELPIVFESATRTRVLAAARLKAKHAMSYADCFAAGLAIEYEACLLTGDSEFTAVKDQIEIAWLS